MKGYLEVGISEDETYVIVNHPDLEPDENGCGHIVFSPHEAMQFATLLIRKALECNVTDDPARDDSDNPPPPSPPGGEST